MDLPILGHFLEGLRGQSKPLGVEAENQRGSRGRRHKLLGLREVFGPLATALGEQRTIEQPDGGAGINRAIPAMDNLRQLRTSGVALHPDLAPAGVDFYGHVFRSLSPSRPVQGRRISCF
jgi:hypothetical protein